jgi:hypothetical protein
VTPPYGVRGPDHRVREPAHRSLRGHLQEPHIVALHARYGVPSGLRRLLAQAPGRLLLHADFDGPSSPPTAACAASLRPLPRPICVPFLAAVNRGNNWSVAAP